MNIVFFENINDVLPYRSQIWNLLKICDHDFCPTLSSREESDNGPELYFEGLFTDYAKFQLAFDGLEVIGFSIFFHNYYSEEIANYTPCNYVKIACVHPDYRGLGIASAFNRFIENELPRHLGCAFIVRRTWTHNIVQVHLLEKNGYEVFLKYDNDRGGGNSTVYYYKVMEPKDRYNFLLKGKSTKFHGNRM